MIRSLLLFFTMFFTGILSAQTAPFVWNAELDEDVQTFRPLMEGKYTYFRAEEYAWVYDNATGKKVWGVEIDDYSEESIGEMFRDSLYLAADGDTIFCFSVLQDSILWKMGYAGIDQESYVGAFLYDTTVVLTYRKTEVAVNLLTGTELWRSPIVYESSLLEKGAVNRLMLEQQGKYLAFTDKEECVLISIETGKRLLTLPGAEPNGDLIEQKRSWYTVSPDHKFVSMMLEKEFLVIDVAENKSAARIPLPISTQFNVLARTPFGPAAFGEEMTVVVNSATGTVSRIPVEVEDIRTVIAAQTDSAAMLILGVEDKMIGWNLTTGKSAWQTALKFEPSNGFIHRFVANDSDNVIVTYLDPSSDLKLSVVSVNAWNGTINYRTFVAHADESLPKRVLPLAVAPAGWPVSFGYENVGFDYSVSSLDGYLTVVIHTGAEMIEPTTTKRGGEGMVRIDMETGDIAAKYYGRIADGISFDGGFSSIAKAVTFGNVLLLPGDKKLVALDATTAEIKWMLIEQDLEKSYIFDMAMVDTVLYVRTGAYRDKFEYDEKRDKIKHDELWEESGYALLAVDTATGKVHWKKTFDRDPGRVFHSYAIAGATHGSQRLFYSDDEFLYSLSLDTSMFGKTEWAFEYSDSGAGSLDYDGLHQLSSAWSKESALRPDSSLVPDDERYPIKQTRFLGETFTTFLSKILHVAYVPGHEKLIVFGDDGIVSVDPATGRRVWSYEWDYNKKAVHHRPMFLNNHIFYFIDGTAVVLNYHTGALVSETSLNKKNPVFIMPNRSSVIAIDGDEVTGIVIPQ